MRHCCQLRLTYPLQFRHQEMAGGTLASLRARSRPRPLPPGAAEGWDGGTVSAWPPTCILPRAGGRKVRETTRNQRPDRHRILMSDFQHLLQASQTGRVVVVEGSTGFLGVVVSLCDGRHATAYL
jgi:hypothetical protein